MAFRGLGIQDVEFRGFDGLGSGELSSLTMRITGVNVWLIMVRGL